MLTTVNDSVHVAPPPCSQCNYVIDVNVHIPWAPEVEVRQPLLIKAADNETVSIDHNTVMIIIKHYIMMMSFCSGRRGTHYPG